MRELTVCRAALHAVQRAYPQIYKSDERLLIKPEGIRVELRDFAACVKRMSKTPLLIALLHSTDLVA